MPSDDRRLRAEVISALDAVAPPAPWLPASTRALLREPRRRPIARDLALAAAAVVLLVLAGGLLTLRWLAAPPPAYPATPQERYLAMLQVHVDEVDRLQTKECGNAMAVSGPPQAPATDRCPAELSAMIAARRRWLRDLDRARPPIELIPINDRLRADLGVELQALSGLVAAYPARADVNAYGAAVATASRANLTTLKDVAWARYQVRSGSPRDYQMLVADDWQLAHEMRLLAQVGACTQLDDPGCLGDLASIRDACAVFLTDLQTATPPPRLAALDTRLRGDLAAQLRALDDFAAAYRAGGGGGSLIQASQDDAEADRALARSATAIIYGP